MSAELGKEFWALRAIEFVREIGIPVQLSGKEVPDLKGFLPSVTVLDGGLIVNSLEVFPGDILHEAGHLAVIPARFRAEAKGDLKEVHNSMHEYLNKHPEGLFTYPEDKLCRAILQADESEATAWQYAAAQAIGLPDELLFPPESYDGESDNVLLMLRSGRYLGINGLQAAGWTSVRKNSPNGLPLYPNLAFWLQMGPAAQNNHA